MPNSDIQGISLPAGQVKVIDMLSENIFLKQSANLTIYGADLDTSSPHKKLIIKNHGTYYFSNRPFTTDMQVVCQITDTDGTVYYGVHDTNYDEAYNQAIGISFVKKSDLDPLIDTSAVQSGNTIDGLMAGSQKFYPKGQVASSYIGKFIKPPDYNVIPEYFLNSSGSYSVVSITKADWTQDYGKYMSPQEPTEIVAQIKTSDGVLFLGFLQSIGYALNNNNGFTPLGWAKFSDAQKYIVGG